MGLGPVPPIIRRFIGVREFDNISANLVKISGDLQLPKNDGQEAIRAFAAHTIVETSRIPKNAKCKNAKI